MARLSESQNKDFCLESALCRTFVAGQNGRFVLPYSDRVRAVSGLKLTRVRGHLCSNTSKRLLYIYLYLFPEFHQQPF